MNTLKKTSRITSDMVPFFDLKAQYLSIKDDIDSAIKDVIDSGWFILGKKGEVFEAEFASYIGSRHAIGVGSGTEALHMGLLSLGIGQGDKVITTPNTAIPTVSAIRFAGAVPLFVDIDPKTYTMSAQALEGCLSKRDRKAKAIIVVHLFGQPAFLDPIIEIARRYDVKIIEDCAQSHGALYKGKKTGSIGDIGAFSFYPTKNVGAYGDGGLCTTNNDEIAERLRLLRNYGQKDRYHAAIEGYNSRLDELQAGILSVKLKKLDGWNERRRQLAALYTSLLDPSKADTPFEVASARHVYHLYVIRHKKRDGLMAHLKDRGIATLIHYPIPIH
ncbi:MAG: DegT/DnrJ/EryC1/StrS family aminotransferase, partial [Deltaproteobacteria bacterium]|nr:DegT/DnrJ/EryC1/StrS family aminotransferase [Deltaproteobacteria bacterium]